MPANMAALMSELAFATPEQVLAAIEEAVKRPDVAALVHERNVAAENYVRKVFGEPPYPPECGPLTSITLKAGLPQ